MLRIDNNTNPTHRGKAVGDKEQDMFTTIKSLTILMDKYISYYLDAKENNLGDEEYYSDMRAILNKQLTELKRLSCNDRLIEKYENKILAL